VTSKTTHVQWSSIAHVHHPPIRLKVVAAIATTLKFESSGRPIKVVTIMETGLSKSSQPRQLLNSQCRIQISR